LLLLTLTALAARAQTPSVSEHALKAVLFFKLPLFVYPKNSNKRTQIGICTLGDVPLGSTPEKLPSKLSDGRRVEFKAINDTNNANECEFIFIGRSETRKLDNHLRNLRSRRLVTVSDIEGFASAGGMVEFALRSDGSGIQILINRKAAQKDDIEFNAQLLRLAKLIEP
jgi:hypothetical protein